MLNYKLNVPTDTTNDIPSPENSRKMWTIASESSASASLALNRRANVPKKDDWVTIDCISSIWVFRVQNYHLPGKDTIVCNMGQQSGDCPKYSSILVRHAFNYFRQSNCDDVPALIFV